LARRFAILAGVHGNDDNPYEAPQTSSPVLKRRRPANLWLGIVGVAGQFVGLQIARYLMPTRLTAYVVGAFLGGAFFLAVIFFVRTFRPELIKTRDGRQPV
jgi:hypothetical protein